MLKYNRILPGDRILIETHELDPSDRKKSHCRETVPDKVYLQRGLSYGILVDLHEHFIIFVSSKFIFVFHARIASHAL